MKSSSIAPENIYVQKTSEKSTTYLAKLLNFNMNCREFKLQPIIKYYCSRVIIAHVSTIRDISSRWLITF